MKFIQLAPHPALCFRHRNAAGESRHVVVMRATFDIAGDGSLIPKRSAPPINFEERCFGEMLTTAPRDESHLAPEKPKVDVILHANAFAPQGRPAPRFEVEVTLRERGGPDPRTGRRLHERRLSVTGPREWRYGGFFSPWQLSDPLPVREVPLRFDRAYGGTVRLDDPARGFERPVLLAHDENPVGCGFVPDAERVAADYDLTSSTAKTLLDEWAQRTQRLAAPQIERHERPISSIGDRPPLAGWGLVAKHWGSRYRHAGTFDAAWAQTRYPHLPVDFDTHYWNGAHDDLQLPSLAEDCIVETRNLVPVERASDQVLRIPLPGLRPTVTLRDVAMDGPVSASMRLDTVIVDLLENELTLLYRFNVADSITLAWIELECNA